jgi:hypothetical protein
MIRNKAAIGLKAILGAGLALLALSAAPASADPIGALRYAGTVILANDMQVDGTLVGGLSGIDYDAASDSFIALSDDKSENAPARFYSLRLAFTDNRLTAVGVERATTLLTPEGQPYPKSGGEVPDPEAVRLDPANTGTLWWTSEGDRRLNLKPFLRQSDRNGKHLFDMPLSPLFSVFPDKESGVRNNLAFEGLSFAPDGQSLWLGMESALYEDGPISTVEAGTVSRFTRVDRGGKVLGQYAYPVEAIPAKPGAGKFADNGVSEILALDDRRILTIERSAVQGEDGNFTNYIRLFEASTEGATDVSNLPALKGESFTPLKKRLVLALDPAVVGKIDNIEGVSWGPKLSTGNRTLILISDNNFNKTQVTEVMAFEVLP